MLLLGSYWTLFSMYDRGKNRHAGDLELQGLPLP
jgi:hypothetical protein